MKNFYAALIFFTRLPFWKFLKVPDESFKHVVPYWPVVGLLTGGCMAGVLWLAAHVFPYPIAVMIAILSRLLITGALHEDGLADFCDGFGGGTSRERILAIMKDSHIGTYGVIGLIFYFLLFWSMLKSIDLSLACPTIIVADVWSKYNSSQIINFLPYARKEEESKIKTIYSKMSFKECIIGAVIALPTLFFLMPGKYWHIIVYPLVMCFFLIRLMKKRLGGYTGDCCGALFLLNELAFYIGMMIAINLYVEP